ncbi:hypothetical protein E6C67_08395 [Azospirillum sp. TSA2s]|uniref:hypothetical protein n=1 Tax=Azospirillum sp. TSA2s TaxID=709810 RepID=UPI0010A9F388|nr:hypothetical protein [Azospirillum sp. TSA2s]QCG93958.1 hypothetical protein E6C67_08395 [Azospirillum sp. TSA2s]
MPLTITTTVITPAGSTALVDLATVKDDWSISGTADDAFLTRTIDRCSAAAAQFCNRVFVVETVRDDIQIERDQIDWPVHGGAAPLQLSRWPVGSVTTVVEDIGTSAVTLVQGVDFTVNPAIGQLTRLDGNGRPRKWPPTLIQVTYTAGYSTIPSDLQDAVSRMVWTRYAERRRDPFVQRVRVDGVDDVTYITPKADAGNLSADVSDILDNYRVPVVG